MTRKRFENKIAVVIGGNSGIGLATARAFAAEGASVVVTGRDAATLDAAAREIGEAAMAIRSDTADLAQIDALMATIGARFGRIDVLVANAGVGAFVPVEQVTEHLYDSIMGVNLKGMYFTIQKALPLMGRGASIVVVSSIAHAKGLPGNSVYAASKAGVRSLARNLAAELVERGIRVNCVSPGPVETPIITRTTGMPAEMVAAMREKMIQHVPMHRMGEPSEVAMPILFLASPDASFITGEDLLIDGGLANF